jgi:hypothetical protein
MGMNAALSHPIAQERETRTITLLKDFWLEAEIRAPANGTDINVMMEKALLLYFDLNVMTHPIMKLVNTSDLLSKV